MRASRLFVAFIVVTAAIAFSPANAQQRSVRLEWQRPAIDVQDADSALADLPLVDFRGARLPMQLTTLQVFHDQAIVPVVEQVESVAWTAPLPQALPKVPPTIGEEYRIETAEPLALPDQPVVVLREGRLRGVRLAIVGLSPLFQQGDSVRSATKITATVPGAAPLTTPAEQLLSSNDQFIAAAPGPRNPVSPAPTVKLAVDRAGIQQVSGATLAAAGMSATASGSLRLRLDGQELPLEINDGGDGVFDASDVLRFYAASPGDRWNRADVYWLTSEPGAPALRIGSRAVPAVAGAASTTAVERGTWQAPALYDTSLAGLDGDHWFAADMKTGPDLPPATFSATLAPTLPLADGALTVQVTGSAYTTGKHTLRVTAGGKSGDASWNGFGDWSGTFAALDNVPLLQLTLVPGADPDGFQPDTITWERQVALQFDGKGAFFSGHANIRQYRLASTPADRRLYDVSDPRTPVLLLLEPGSDPTFQDGAGGRDYLLSGPGTLHAPVASARGAGDPAAKLNAQVLYIAPGAFHDAIAPLVAHRRAQGYSVAVVDVQTIYDGWSYGQVSPDAIRAFLRYAAAAWDTKPIAVTLVGDGTNDPFDYSGYNSATSANNVLIIPPYLAMVDPWVRGLNREAACDTCYGQLDGDDPLSDMLPDIQVGRLPVKRPSELQQVVAKILRYETGPLDLSWRSRSVYIADNFILQQQNGKPIYDPAGDFAEFSERSVVLQPAQLAIDRLYFDPAWTPRAPYREPNAKSAHDRTMALLSRGAGLVNFTGHGNQFQWAVTNTDADPAYPERGPGYLLSLYDPDRMANGDRLPIVLEMTCLTSAFQLPSFSGTTIDERFVLRPNGGAVAVWGPSGNGVAHGHDALQRGFYQALWRSPPMQARLGELTAAGYAELFASDIDAQDALRTFLLLGDPLTPARVLPAHQMYLPLARR